MNCSSSYSADFVGVAVGASAGLPRSFRRASEIHTSTSLWDVWFCLPSALEISELQCLLLYLYLFRAMRVCVMRDARLKYACGGTEVRSTVGSARVKRDRFLMRDAGVV